MRTVPARRSEFDETDEPPQSPIRLYGPDTREMVQTYFSMTSDCASSHYGTSNVGCDRTAAGSPASDCLIEFSAPNTTSADQCQFQLKA